MSLISKLLRFLLPSGAGEAGGTWNNTVLTVWGSLLPQAWRENGESLAEGPLLRVVERDGLI